MLAGLRSLPASKLVNLIPASGVWLSLGLPARQTRAYDWNYLLLCQNATGIKQVGERGGAVVQVWFSQLQELCKPVVVAAVSR